MKKKLAFVLGGGGSRGAMQVGALRALFEEGYLPDLVTGTSIGAANGAFLAVQGWNIESIHRLELLWQTMADQDLLPTNLWWQTMRAFFQRSKGFSQDRIREFAITSGLSPELRFRDLGEVKFYPVAADLNAGCPVVFGTDPNDSILECVLASMSLPPWMAPAENAGRLLVDGGFVSNLPIEAALDMGATEIIALDLFDPSELDRTSRGVTAMINRVDQTVIERQLQLELRLAEARGVPVRIIRLLSEPPVPLWDFRHSAALIERGSQLGRQAAAAWRHGARPAWWRREGMKALLARLLRG